MIQYSYLIPLFPLLGFLINGLGWNKIPKSLAGVIGSSSILASFVVSLAVFVEVLSPSFQGPFVQHYFDFIQSGTLYIPFAFQIDALSASFLLIITGIGFLIHVYSTSYMHDDEGMVKYFAYLNLFVFSMLLLVMGANYIIMFIGWEGVGLCSYLLIGFWFKNHAYTDAAKKAFVMNRIGDLGFLVGMLLVLYHFHTLSYQELFDTIKSSADQTNIYTAIAICFFIGAMGKSAQIPLYTWLPDAMAGPTPVSALIHAATMVTAGIYMIARSSVLYNLAPIALDLITWIGLATALLAASIAIKQNDIKKVLAYSTVSQLGFMFVAIGMGAYTTAVFHVITHAFFKALLFLGSGSVIHAMGGEQDIRFMGGLGKKMPITKITFLIGCLAIAGIPGFAGFFSKDEILAHAYAHQPLLFVALLMGALMTAFYMFRLYFLTFTGSFRGTEQQAHHLHESPKAISEKHWLHDFLSTAVAEKELHELSHATEWLLIGVSVGLVLVMIAFAYKATQKAQFTAAKGFGKILENKWYVDELYQAIILTPLNHLGVFLQQIIEKSGIDALVNNIGTSIQWLSTRVRLLQSGIVGSYIFVMVLGIILLLSIGFLSTIL